MDEIETRQFWGNLPMSDVIFCNSKPAGVLEIGFNKEYVRIETSISIQPYYFISKVKPEELNGAIYFNKCK